MGPRRNNNLAFSQLITAIVPIVLWVALWLSVGGGNARDIINASTLRAFGDGLRSIFPFVAGSVALALILTKFPEPRPWRMLFVGPLGLATVYGAVGILAVLVSPDGSTAISWTAAYISVPLVLWSVTWGADPLKQLYRLINVTWAALVLAAGALFTIALVYMDLGEVIRNPSGFFQCEDAGHWFTQTSGILRSTGVGRYAALASIIAFTGLWRGKSRWLWALVLLGALMLISTSGARTSMLGLIAAIGLATLIYGGRWAVIAGVLALVILMPLHYLTEFDRVFLDECFFHQGLPSPAQEGTAPDLHLQSTPQTENEDDVQSSRPSNNAQTQTRQTLIDDDPGDAQAQVTPTTVARDSHDARVRTQVVPSPIQVVPSPITEDPSVPKEQMAPTLISEEPSDSQAEVSPTPIPEVRNIAQSQTAPTLIPKEPSDSQAKVSPTPIPEVHNIAQSQTAPTLIPKEPSRTRVEVSPTPIPEQSDGAQAQVLRSQIGTRNESKEFPISKTQTANQPSIPQGSLDNTPTEGTLLNLSGRTGVWGAGVELVKDSPILGHGFHADRIILEAHMHNALLHALVQTGFAGAIPFAMALCLTWFLVLKALRNLNRLSDVDKHMIIQMAALLAFLSVRAIAESTGAFFGVDWLLLALVFFYFQIVGYTIDQQEESP